MSYSSEKEQLLINQENNIEDNIITEKIETENKIDKKSSDNKDLVIGVMPYHEEIDMSAAAKQFKDTDKLLDGHHQEFHPITPDVGFRSASVNSFDSAHGYHHGNGYAAMDDTQLHCHTKDKSRLQDVRAAQRKLVIASIVCLIFMIAEFVGGILSGSLAIMTDAAHLLSDFGGFLISLFALYLGTRKPSKKLSFGWHRAEVMGALVSVLIIWVLTGVLVYEAILRVKSMDFEVNAVIMLITSGVGVLVNIILGLTLHGSGHGHSHGLGGGHNHSHGGSPKSSEKSLEDQSHHGHSHSHDSSETESILKDGKSKLKKDLNVRAAFIHVIGDLVQSIGVFLAALLIYFKPEWKVADPICTFLFSILVLFTTLTILKDILMVLMEGTPKGLDFKEVFEDLQNIRAVKMVHNLHVWSLTMGTAALSVHLAVDDTRSTHSVLREAQTLVAKKYEIHHSTIQVEKFHEQMDNCSMCEEPKD